jgi:hypothetical protein
MSIGYWHYGICNGNEHGTSVGINQNVVA